MHAKGSRVRGPKLVRYHRLLVNSPLVFHAAAVGLGLGRADSFPGCDLLERVDNVVCLLGASADWIVIERALIAENALGVDHEHVGRRLGAVHLANGAVAVVKSGNGLKFVSLEVIGADPRGRVSRAVDREMDKVLVNGFELGSHIGDEACRGHAIADGATGVDPLEDDVFALEVGEFVGLAVDVLKREVRRDLADFSLLGRWGCRARAAGRGIDGRAGKTKHHRTRGAQNQFLQFHRPVAPL